MNPQQTLNTLQDSAATASLSVLVASFLAFMLLIIVCMAASHDEHEQAMKSTSLPEMLPHTGSSIGWLVIAIGACIALFAVFAPVGKLAKNADNHRPVTVERAYPTPTPHNTLNQMSTGERLREEARRNRELRWQNSPQSGQSSSFPFPFSGK